jgi:YVTN family beta-propeller protein
MCSGMRIHDGRREAKSRILTRSLGLAAAMASLCGGTFAATDPAQAAIAYKAYVGNYASGTLSPINTATNGTGASIAVSSPSAIAITPDGAKAYVCDYERGKATGHVTPVTLQTGALGSPIAVGAEPISIAITPDGTKAYVANYNKNEASTVTVITLSSGETETIAVGKGPYSVVVTPDGSKAYVANHYDGTVTPITVATNKAGSPIKVGAGEDLARTDWLAVSPNGATVYAADFGTPVLAPSEIVPITVATNEAGTPITGVTKPNAIAISPDGATAYIAEEGIPGDVVPMALSNNKLGSPVTVGNNPYDVAITPDQATGYVANYNSELASFVTPINLQTGLAETNINVENGPDSVAITPDQAPDATFKVNAAATGSASSFDASESTVTYGSITSYRWNFGDGNASTTATPTVTHTYEAAGTYTVTLTETDSAGTSTSQVFTGQTMSRDGGPDAQFARSLTVNSAPSVTTQPSSATVTAPNRASFTVVCSGSPAPKVQWQLSADGGASWSDMAEQTSATLTNAATTPALSGRQYRARCTNVAGSATSNAATLTVKGAAVGSGSAPPAPPGRAPGGAGVVVSPRSVTLTANGVVVIEVRCPASAVRGCKGTVTLTLAEPRARRARAVVAKCARGCRSLGSTNYEARAGRRVRVRVHMASFGRKLLARRKALRVTVTATSVSEGHVSRMRRTIIVRAH